MAVVAALVALVSVAAWGFLLVNTLLMPTPEARRDEMRARIEVIRPGVEVIAEQVGGRMGDGDTWGCDWLCLVTPDEFIRCERPRLARVAEGDWDLAITPWEQATVTARRRRQGGCEIVINGYGGFDPELVFDVVGHRMVDQTSPLATAGL